VDVSNFLTPRYVKLMMSELMIFHSTSIFLLAPPSQWVTFPVNLLLSLGPWIYFFIPSCQSLSKLNLQVSFNFPWPRQFF
jgi:hypothetical protein